MHAENVLADGREPVHAPGLSFHRRLDLACDSSATRCAVAYASEVFRNWEVPTDVAADALLIVDELVTNAVRHSGVSVELFGAERDRPGVGRCGLALWACRCHLMVGVRDEADQVPVLREVSLEAENGRGIRIVAGLSDGAWGYTVQPSRPGKLVWARLPLSGRTSSTAQLHVGGVA